jgi:class 3 adenylate cyclase
MIRIARRMALRINKMSAVIDAIRGMQFDDINSRLVANPPVQEMAQLQSGITLLHSALRSFSLYVPIGVVRKLIEEGKTIAPGVERREMTILFCDLENFSTLAQDISAEELLKYSTEYFSIATEAITRHGGTVDKFIGDAVMGFWGAPDLVPDHAVRACRAALDIVHGLERANQEWQLEGKRALRVRVGINSASVLVGNIGSSDRLSYTTIGDGVNVASRLEGKNKELGTTICVSDSTYERAKNQIVARPIRPVSVKGRSGEFMVYELIDMASDQDLKSHAG